MFQMKNILIILAFTGLILGGAYYFNLAGQNPGNPKADPTGDGHESPSKQTDIAMPPETVKVDDTQKTIESSVELSDRNVLKTEPSFLPTENSLMDKSGATFDAESINAVLSSDDYYATLSQLKKEQLSNSEATKVTDAYTDLIDSFPELAGGADFELNDLSCGLKLCMGSINTFDNGDTWRKFVVDYMGGQGEGAFGAMSSYPIQLDENILENRFVFSIDPSANTFAITLDQNSVIYSGDIEPTEGTDPTKGQDGDG